MSDRVWPIDGSILDDPKRRVVRLDIHYAVGQRERDTVESALRYRLEYSNVIPARKWS